MRRKHLKKSPLEKRLHDSQRRHDRKQVIKRNQKRKRRRHCLLFIVLLLLLAAAGYGIWTFVRREFLAAQLDAIPEIRERANHAVLGDVLPSDTEGRALSRAEKTADAKQLQQLLQYMPKHGQVQDSAAVESSLETMVKKAGDTHSDMEFFDVLQQMVQIAAPSSHMADSNTYERLARNLGSGFYATDSPYAKAVGSERVKDRYEKLRTEVAQRQPAETKPSTSSAEASLAYTLPKMSVDAATDTAILSGFTFEDGAYRQQKAALKKLLQEACSHKKILFDLRHTDGFSVEYWTEGLLPYLITSTYGVQTRLFFPDGFDDYVDYLSVKERMESFDLEDARQKTEGLKSAEAQKAVQGMAYAKTLIVSAKGASETLAPAKLALLVDQTTGGAAETFADFCRRLENVRVFGSKTAGTAWKLPAFPVALTHSGYIALLDASIALVPDSDALQSSARVQPDTLLASDDPIAEVLRKFQ